MLLNQCIALCSRTFDLLQKTYVVVEGSPKRHGDYMACVSDMHLDEGLTSLQSLCQTQWAVRSVNLRIVQRCLPAQIKHLEMQTDADSAGLLVSIADFRFVLGLNFLSEVFMLVIATSEALQAKDNDLALAATSVDNLKTAITALRSDIKNYQRLFNAAKQRCESLHIGEEPIDQSSKNVRRPARKRKVPASLQGCALLDLFLTKSSDTLPFKSAEEQLLNEMKLDFFC
jgi:hypothetical protein